MENNEQNNEQNLPVKKQVMVPADIEAVLIHGDLSKLTPSQRINYYRLRCEELGVNPLSRPFDYLVLNGKTVLYGNKNLTDQLRGNRQVSISEPNIKHEGGLFIVTVTARDKYGREDADMGVVPTQGMSGDKLANAMMKAITKAKRRVTLSICSAGCMDESELESVEGAKRITVDHDTGEFLGELPTPESEQAAATEQQGEWIYKPPFPKKDLLKAAGARYHGESKTWRSSKELPEFSQWLDSGPNSHDPQVDPPHPSDDEMPSGPGWDEPAPKTTAAPKPAAKAAVTTADKIARGETFNL